MALSRINISESSLDASVAFMKCLLKAFHVFLIV